MRRSLPRTESYSTSGATLARSWRTRRLWAWTRTGSTKIQHQSRLVSPWAALSQRLISLMWTGGYNVILMNHTLEHLHDPVALLTAASAALAPGGTLLVN